MSAVISATRRSLTKHSRIGASSGKGGRRNRRVDRRMVGTMGFIKVVRTHCVWTKQFSWQVTSRAPRGGTGHSGWKQFWWLSSFKGGPTGGRKKMIADL